MLLLHLKKGKNRSRGLFSVFYGIFFLSIRGDSINSGDYGKSNMYAACSESSFFKVATRPYLFFLYVKQNSFVHPALDYSFFLVKLFNICHFIWIYHAICWIKNAKYVIFLKNHWSWTHNAVLVTIKCTVSIQKYIRRCNFWQI